MPLYAFSAGAEGVAALADKKDAVLDADGNRVAGSGRDYTDQTELGAYLLDQMAKDGTDEPVAPQEPVDWNALKTQVLANFEATGSWYL